MKKHNTIKVVLWTIVGMLLLSWILPAAYYSGEYVDQGRVQMGLSELFNYPMTALSYFGHISLFVIFVGGFYGILYKIPAYRTFLDKIVSKFERKEKLFLAIVIILLSLGVSIAGTQISFALFIPFIVAVILMMGYDKIVAALTVVGSIVAGLVGSTYAYNNLSILGSVLGLETDYQIGVRFVILAVAVILVMINTFMYISKHLKGATIDKKSKSKDELSEKIEEEEIVEKSSSTSKPKNSSSKKSNSKKGGKANSSKGNKSSKSSKSNNKPALMDEDVLVSKGVELNDSDDDYLVPTKAGTTNIIWPFVTGFILMFVLVVMAFITWGDGGFGTTFFDDLTNNVTGYELFGFAIFSKIYGSINSFGNWTLIDFFLPMSLLIIILAVIYKVKVSDILDGFADGTKKALAPAFVALLAYTILVITTYHPFQMSVYKAVLGLSKGFNIATTTIVGILSAVFNVDSAYAYQSVLPYYVSIVTNQDNYGIVGIIFQTMYGFSALFAPTSLVLMCTLSYLKVSYKDWLRNVWKLLLELFVVLLIIFILLALI